MQRRSFLSVLAGASAALGLARYAEPFALTPDAHHEWVEDKGDYVIIRVPDFKTFARETINKPPQKPLLPRRLLPTELGKSWASWR